MKYYQKKEGFTLIELLVVVLIIGILSAIALPQYQTAVEKARVSEAFVLAKHFKDAEELYKMANGNYTDSFEELAIDIPGGYTVSNSGKQIAKDFLAFSLLTNIDRVLVSYFYNGKYTMSISVLLDSLGGGRTCCAYSRDNYRSERLCKSLGAVGEGRNQCWSSEESGCKCWDLP